MVDYCRAGSSEWAEDRRRALQHTFPSRSEKTSQQGAQSADGEKMVPGQEKENHQPETAFSLSVSSSWWFVLSKIPFQDAFRNRRRSTVCRMPPLR
jgi:hypothetical protein